MLDEHPKYRNTMEKKRPKRSYQHDTIQIAFFELINGVVVLVQLGRLDIGILLVVHESNDEGRLEQDKEDPEGVGR